MESPATNAAICDLLVAALDGKTEITRQRLVAILGEVVKSIRALQVPIFLPKQREIFRSVQTILVESSLPAHFVARILEGFHADILDCLSPEIADRRNRGKTARVEKSLVCGVPFPELVVIFEKHMRSIIENYPDAITGHFDPSQCRKIGDIPSQLKDQLRFGSFDQVARDDRVRRSPGELMDMRLGRKAAVQAFARIFPKLTERSASSFFIYVIQRLRTPDLRGRLSAV